MLRGKSGGKINYSVWIERAALGFLEKRSVQKTVAAETKPLQA
jgi:hypothetical protein